MKLLKNIFFYGIFGTFIFFIWKIFIVTPCSQIIEYDIGTFDNSFRITQKEFINQIEMAEVPWETTAGRELFRYVPGADFKVNLIFSEEQARLYKGNDLENTLDNKQETIDSVQSRYQSAVTRYERTKRDYETKLKSYEQEVIRWNNLGGAPKETFESLQKEAQSLDRKADEVNHLLAQVNKLADENNNRVEEYNSNVSEYNELFNSGHEFDAGNTDGTEINVYSYNNLEELRTLLIHEFGHVLGIDHVEDESSVMYYLLNEKNQKGELTEVDINELQLSCRL